MEINQGRRVHMEDVETDAVQTLLDEFGKASITRRDPEESGPLLVQFSDKTFEVDEDGEISEA